METASSFWAHNENSTDGITILVSQPPGEREKGRGRESWSEKERVREGEDGRKDKGSEGRSKGRSEKRSKQRRYHEEG